MWRISFYNQLYYRKILSDEHWGWNKSSGLARWGWLSNDQQHRPSVPSLKSLNPVIPRLRKAPSAFLSLHICALPWLRWQVSANYLSQLNHPSLPQSKKVFQTASQLSVTAFFLDCWSRWNPERFISISSVCAGYKASPLKSSHVAPSLEEQKFPLKV